MDMTDSELLQRYVRDQSESAFAELVTRHISLVHAAALRQVNGDEHLAEDVTQSVFADLARKAAKLLAHTSLTGWLYTSTRFVAANSRRNEQRRITREQEAHAMNHLLSLPESQPDWLRLSPLLDEAMHQLDEPDREAVLLRHFEKCSFAEVGTKIGLTENAARMRVERALEKLHGILAKQGVALGIVALAGLLGANAVIAAPAQLAAKVVAGAMAGAAAGGTISIFSKIIFLMKTKAAMSVLTATLIAGLGFVYVTRSAPPPENNFTAPAVAVAAVSNNFSPATTNFLANANTTNAAMAKAKRARKMDSQKLHLSIVAADSGKPIPMVPIEYRGWAGGKFKGKSFTSDRFGECDVDYPTNITELQLTTRKDGIADTRLLWRPPNGDVIPTNYLLRVNWPVAIGGTVVDADGKPVAGARIGVGHNEDPTITTLPQSNDFGFEETTSDETGHWQINRIAEEMISRLSANASHTNYTESQRIDLERDKSPEKQLRDGTFVFKLGRAVMAAGSVTDTNGTPVPDAKILVGYYQMSGNRTGKSQADGTFSVLGCQPGKQIVTAEALGFAPTTMEAELGENSGPVHLILKPGKTLRLRVVDVYGTPIPQAYIWHQNFDHGMINPNRPKTVQVDFSPRTDKSGRAFLANAPDVEMEFAVQADGFLRADEIKIRPDGEEHLITLNKALLVHGTVLDDSTGERIPKFRIIQGWPEWNPVDGTTNAQWSTLNRFWLDFSGGSYSNNFEEAVVSGTPNQGYFLKFIAEGYRPFVSRMIGANEGEVELNVKLHAAQAASIAIVAPNGRTAAFADVGMVAPGAHLELVPGGFSRENIQSGGSLLRADKNGAFTLPTDPAVTRVIATSAEGYAEATPAELTANPVLRLQPWGRLDATIFSGGKPASGREYTLKLVGASADTVDFDFLHLPTDARGKLVIEKLPPGKIGLAQVVSVQLSEGSNGSHTGWTHGEPKTFFEIRPGETTKLELGVSNCTIIAHLQWPAGMSRNPAWRMDAGISTPMPSIPPEIMTNQVALQQLTQTEEFKAMIKIHHFYQATVNDDDTITVEDVEPGNYQLFVAITPKTDAKNVTVASGSRVIVQRIAWGEIKVNVSADSSSRTIDVGAVELKLVAEKP